MSHTGTMRGTPKNRNQPARAQFVTDGPSGIPRPALDAHASHLSHSDATSTLSASRAKMSKRDEAIRRKIETDLNKKKNPAGRVRPTRKAPRLMAAKREDCVLVTDDDDHVAGIFTAKDLAFRVVGGGKKAQNVTIEEIMTKNPLCAKTDTSATDALDLMVRKGFRHLPVMDEDHNIAGILDITKCFYDAMEKLERAYSSSRKLYDALEGVQAEMGSSQPQQIIQYVEAIRQKMSGPTLESVLTGLPPTTVSVRTSVKEAAELMKENHTTAVLVQDQGSITGIFTSKDVVLRVIAAGLDPVTCSVVRVMTPHPDFAPMDMSIQSALRKMHDGHYLNLPVMSDAGEIVGMVDVLKLTYATLDQINNISTGDSEGPAWNKFWLSLDNDTESIMSGDGSSRMPGTPDARSMMSHHDRPGLMDRGDSVLPNDSASHHGESAPPSAVASAHPTAVEDTPFPFKFKAPSGRVHRLQVTASAGIEELVSAVASKLGAEVDSIGGAPTFDNGKISKAGFALSYLDNEGDTVSITTYDDLVEAISLSRLAHREKVDLFVHDPEKPPMPAEVNPQPALPKPVTPPASVLRERKQFFDDEEEAPPKSKTKSQAAPQAQAPEVIPGVPNDVLLPGAIGVLAVVIVVVFTIGRASGSSR
ncbi:CBS-domain-containing protein [Lizonia empirigonia]|nr:CBS-domain-containing protein [Lizonia empirigonia]